jgi:hypothetical protein
VDYHVTGTATGPRSESGAITAVRGILPSPEYTGYMVRSKRATETDGAKPNPPEARVGSSRPSHRAVKARGHFPNEQAALKCVYLAIMSLDRTGKGRKRWITRWKAA